MKCFLCLVAVLIIATSTMAMPSKISLTSQEDYGALHQTPEHYKLVVLAPLRYDDYQRHNLVQPQGTNWNDLLSALESERFLEKRSLDSIAGAVSKVSKTDLQLLRKLLLSKLSKSTDLEDNSVMKRNFDEIDKASVIFSTLNQLT